MVANKRELYQVKKFAQALNRFRFKKHTEIFKKRMDESNKKMYELLLK